MIFSWPGRHTLHFVLPFCFLLALFFHAALFYLFSVSYPRSGLNTARPAQVFFLPVSDASFPVLAAILRSDDPAIFAPGRGVSLSNLPAPSRYSPIYEEKRSLLDPLSDSPSAKEQTVRFSGPVKIPLPPPQEPAQPVSLPTCLSSSPSLASRIPQLPGDAKFECLSGQNLEPTTFLISVSPEGDVDHIILEKSSGNSQLDARAIEILRPLKFSPAGSINTWGEVSFCWGTNVRPPLTQ